MARPTRLGSPEGALRARAGAGASVSTCRPVRQRLLGLRAPVPQAGAAGDWLSDGLTPSRVTSVPLTKRVGGTCALRLFFPLHRHGFSAPLQLPVCAAASWEPRRCVQVGGGGRGCRWNVGERRRPTCPGDKVAHGGQCGDQAAPGPGGPPSCPRGGWGRPGLSAGAFQGRRSGLQAGRGGSAPTPGLRVLGGSAEPPRFSCRV